jgi:PLP dependent protein
LSVNINSYKSIHKDLALKNVTLVAVSKTKSIEEILVLYHLGQRDFGENYVQELVEKYEQLPKDINWHFIGHLQSNKVKQIAPFVSLIHSVDSLKLLKEIDKEAKKNNRQIDCLLQVFIAKEETKFGLDEEELNAIITYGLNTDMINPDSRNLFKSICIKGLMGMASFTDNKEIVRTEFRFLKSLFDKLASSGKSNYQMSVLSMGMSADYEIAIEEGSNMVRIGSLLFGKRNPKNASEK